MSLAIVTTGPSSSPIDGVRRITNFATGEIGAFLAEALRASGFAVVVLRGRGATHRHSPEGVAVEEFETNDDLARLLAQLAASRANETHAIFHAAALSDYAVTAVRGPDGSITREQKIPGNLAPLQLTLEPAAKVLPRLRGWFPQALITAWKYELEGDAPQAIAAARRQITRGYADFSVLNGEAYGPGFGLLAEDKSPVHFANKRELADFLASQAAVFAKSFL
ncbi:MAG: phosphopantothenoylcysteine decarboxylase [Chthoniobacterales bacterium]|jgi:phosphopantothenoylcysteine decarboxylase/phosphopantothenate--cysteine ligase